MLDEKVLEEALRIERLDLEKTMQKEKGFSKAYDVDIIEMPVLVKTHNGEICIKIVGDIMHTYNKLIRDKKKNLG